MLDNKRKSRRRHVRYTAWLALEGNKLHGCLLSDASDGGARLEIEDSKIVPDSFTLLLAGNGSARRNCRVVWRKPQQVGVTFERPHARRNQATLVPALDADKVAAQTGPAETD